MFLLPTPEVKAMIELERALLGKKATPTAAEFYVMLETTRRRMARAHHGLQAWAHTAHMLEPFVIKPAKGAPWVWHAMERARHELNATIEVAAFKTKPRLDKPEWRIHDTIIDHQAVKVDIKEIPVGDLTELEGKAAKLLHFSRDTPRKDPPVLLFAPVSGHYSTLLRNTIKDLLPNHDVYVVDWQNPRDTPGLGEFGLNDYISMAMKYINHFKGDIHVVGVCQPGPALLAAVSLMHQINEQREAQGLPPLHVPRTLSLLASPIDTDKSPQAPNVFAHSQTRAWFKDTATCAVPDGFGFKGAGEWVYCGGQQGFSFMSMKEDWHHNNMKKRYEAQVQGNHVNAMERDEFYEEYLSFMDVPGRLYVDTVGDIFQDNLLAKGEMKWTGTIAGQSFLNMTVDPSAIKYTSLGTYEGKRDDITGEGQCHAAQTLASRLPPERRVTYTDPIAAHYSIFDGPRFRGHVMPVLGDFIRDQDPNVYAPRSNPKLGAPESRLAS